MKKNRLFIFLSSVVLLSGCTGNSHTSSFKTEADYLEETLSSIGHKFHTKYQTERGYFDYYSSDNYIYDSSLNMGLVLMNNGGCYEFTIAEDQIVCSLPTLNDRAYLATYQSDISLSLSDFTLESGRYYSTDTEVCDTVASLANFYNIDRVEIEWLNDHFTFYLFYHSSLVVQGIMNKEENEMVTSFIEKYHSPNEVGTLENEVENLFKNLKSNYTFEGYDYLTKTSIFSKMNENGFINAASNKYINGAGYVLLEDGAHTFSLNSSTLTVAYEVAYSRSEYIKTLSLNKVLPERFVKTSEHSYLTNDPLNIYNLSNFFAVDSEKVSYIILIIQEEGTQIEFYYQSTLILDGIISSIGSTEIEFVDDYVSTNQKPKLYEYKNEELVALTSSLTTNFTYYKESDYEEGTYYQVLSTEQGRYLIKDEILRSKSDYFAYEGNYYPYTYEMASKTLNLQIEDVLSQEEYHSLYSFESINFKTFVPISSATYRTEDSQTLQVLNHLLDGNENASYQDYATIEIQDGKLYFTLVGKNMTWSKGYIDAIGKTSIAIFEGSTYNIPAFKEYKNQELQDFIHEVVVGANFTVEYASNHETSDIYDEKDYDYWTKDAVYFGFYENGVVKSEQGYFYEYGNVTDEDSEETYFTIGSHPFVYDSLEEFNALHQIDGSVWISRIENLGDGNYQTSYHHIMDAFLNLFGLTQIDCSRMEFSLVNHELEVRVYEDEDLYGPMKITHVGTTIIPSFANTPHIY